MNRSVPLILAVALFMEQMDSTVIATALPAIAADIGSSPVTLKLALTSYLVSLAIFIPVSSWMADRFGAKRVFTVAIAVFVVGSVCCALAGSLIAFVGARFLEGMGGAMMTPVARLVLVRATPKSELVSAMAWLTIPALMGPLVGPPVGGFITTFVSWHWIFLINVPIGLAGIWVASRVLPEIEPAELPPLDLRGFALAAVTAAGIVFGLSVVSLPALPSAVGAATLALGALGGIAYLLHARRTPQPLLDPKLFANPTFRAAVIGGMIFRIGNGAVPFLLPLMLQVGFGLTPFASGMLTFVAAFGALAMKFFAPFTLRTGGFRRVLVLASLLGASLIALNATFTEATPAGLIVAILIMAGFVRSLFFTSVNALVFADIEPAEMGQATAIAAVSQQISIALGVAIAGGVLEGATLFGHAATSPAAFSAAFLSIAAICALAALPFLSLSGDAGSSVSGHIPARGADGDPTQPL
ncbi:MAG: MFS transporter [Rhizobiaceae bacterium]